MRGWIICSLCGVKKHFSRMTWTPPKSPPICLECKNKHPTLDKWVK